MVAAEVVASHVGVDGSDTMSAAIGSSRAIVDA
jgi:hypothetical protein